MPSKTKKFVKYGVEYTSIREYYNAVERGEAKNDFGNPFLMHFGFNYWGYAPDDAERKELRKYGMKPITPPSGGGRRSSDY